MGPSPPTSVPTMFLHEVVGHHGKEVIHAVGSFLQGEIFGWETLPECDHFQPTGTEI